MCVVYDMCGVHTCVCGMAHMGYMHLCVWCMVCVCVWCMAQAGYTRVCMHVWPVWVMRGAPRVSAKRGQQWGEENPAQQQHRGGPLWPRGQRSAR